MYHASDFDCVVCAEKNTRTKAVAFWPVCDPDIPSRPYCRACLDAVKVRLLERFLEIRDEREAL